MSKLWSVIILEDCKRVKFTDNYKTSVLASRKKFKTYLHHGFFSFALHQNLHNWYQIIYVKNYFKKNSIILHYQLH